MRTTPVTFAEIRCDFWNRIITLPLNAYDQGEGGVYLLNRALIAGLMAERRQTVPDTLHPVHVHQCALCYRSFAAVPVSGRNLAPRFCSNNCERRFPSVIQAAKVSRKRAEARAGLCCEECGQPLSAARSTARYCSGRCRTITYRKRLTTPADLKEAVE